MGELVSRKTLVKQALNGIIGIAGGLVMFLLTGLHWIAGIIIGGIIALIGLATSKDSKLGGLVLLAGGLLVVVAKLPLPILSGLSKILIVMGGIVLLATGGFSIFQFIKNLKQRS